MRPFSSCYASAQIRTKVTPDGRNLASVLARDTPPPPAGGPPAVPTTGASLEEQRMIGGLGLSGMGSGGGGSGEGYGRGAPGGFAADLAAPAEPEPEADMADDYKENKAKSPAKPKPRQAAPHDRFHAITVQPTG